VLSLCRGSTESGASLQQMADLGLVSHRQDRPLQPASVKYCIYILEKRVVLYCISRVKTMGEIIVLYLPSGYF
jgi:hypothetical protein